MMPFHKLATVACDNKYICTDVVENERRGDVIFISIRKKRAAFKESTSNGHWPAS